MHILSDAQAASLRSAVAEVNAILDGASFVSLDSAPAKRTSPAETPKSQVKTRVSRRKRGKRALNAEQVGIIKAKLASGQGATAIAREFGVHATTVNCIKYGKTWKDVPAAVTEVVLTA